MNLHERSGVYLYCSLDESPTRECANRLTKSHLVSISQICYAQVMDLETVIPMFGAECASYSMKRQGMSFTLCCFFIESSWGASVIHSTITTISPQKGTVIQLPIGSVVGLLNTVLRSDTSACEPSGGVVVEVYLCFKSRILRGRSAQAKQIHSPVLCLRTAPQSNSL